MRSIVLIGVLGGVLAGCSSNVGQEASTLVSKNSQRALRDARLPHIGALPEAVSSIASMSDRGSLVAYAEGVPRHEGASTMREIQLSEAHAINAIRAGGMVVQTPDGRPIRLDYDHHIKHPDGNWTWVGRPEGAKPGTEAILTFGRKAVFGTIPDGLRPALEIGTSGGKTWMVETDANKLAANMAASPMTDADAITAPVSSGNATVASLVQAGAQRIAAASTKQTAAPKTSAALIASAAPLSGSGSTGPSSGVTVDVLLGYTAAFATRLGGAAQAVTRLDNMVAIANQALLNSRVGGQIRLAGTVQVAYPDDTTNRSALMELSGLMCSNVTGPGQLYLPDSGVNCTTTTVPAALQPLLARRDAVGADLTVLVRNFTSPGNQSCGVAWLLGGAQTGINAASIARGLAVVSDSSGGMFPSNGSVCRSETLAHELGHALGVAHDRATAAGADDTDGDTQLLDPEEFGRYTYSFGYKTDAAGGNFYDIMSVPSLGQTSFRVYSNPRILFCDGAPCGINSQADAALTLGQTFPAVSAFRGPRTPIQGVGLRGDYDGDGRADSLWHNAFVGSNVIWKGANSSSLQAVSTVPDLAWAIAGAGDFDGDGKSDILWRHASLGNNTIWRSGNAATGLTLQKVPDMAWTIAGIGDFNNDHRDDILWRNISSGANLIWRSANGATTQAVATAATDWSVVAVADFDGNGQADIVFRNRNDGRNVMWRNGNSATATSLTWVTSQAWVAVGAGDFDGDGRADLFWRNANTGGNVIWKQGNGNTTQAVTTVAAATWVIVGIGDFDADGRDDLMWRNSATGQNVIWRSANSATTLPVTTVTPQSWVVSG